MWAVGTTLELRVSLCTNPERVICHLNEFDKSLVGRGATANKACFFKARAIVVVELITMAMALADNSLAICGGNFCTWFKLRLIGTETHRSAHVGHITLVDHQVDNRVLRCRIELS